MTAAGNDRGHPAIRVSSVRFRSRRTGWGVSAFCAFRSCGQKSWPQAGNVSSDGEVSPDGDVSSDGEVSSDGDVSRGGDVRSDGGGSSDGAGSRGGWGTPRARG